MAYKITICEGQRYELMVRAAQCALAVAAAQPCRILFARQEAYAPWLHLLSPTEQLRLRSLAKEGDATDAEVGALSASLEQMGEAATAAVWQAASAQLEQSIERPLIFSPSHAVPPLPAAHSALLLLDGAADSEASTWQRYERVAAVVDPSCPGHPALRCLAPPVDPVCFAPHPRAGPPGAAPTLLLADGNLAATLRVAQWLLDARAPHVVIFDPYAGLADYVAFLGGPLEHRLRHVDGCDAAGRAELYQRCSSVLAVGPQRRPDNHFLCEAWHTGTLPLGMLIPDDGSGWQAHSVAQARTALVAGASAACPTYASPSNFAERLPTALRRPTQTQQRSTQVGPHTVTVHALGATLDTPLPTASGAQVVLLCPGARARSSPALIASLQHASGIFYDAGENALLLVDVAAQAVAQPPIRLVQAVAQLESWLQQDTPTQVVVVHLDDSNARRMAIAAALRGSQTRRAGATPPRVLVHLSKRFASGPSQLRIGASVATESICAGLVAAAPGSFSLRWLGKPMAHGERGRVYFYPYGSSTGLDGDECDYAALPELLRRAQLDVLCCLDPFLVGSMGARARWAPRPLPVVGMLHSVHSAASASDVVFALLSGASYPFDAIISPSVCGKQAFAGLLEAASDWLGQSMAPAAAPRFAGRMEVIPYGIDTSPYQRLHTPSCRAALGWPHAALIVLCMGRLHRQEKADLLPLLFAVQALRQRNLPVTLVLAGGASKQAPYSDALVDAVHALDLDDCVQICTDVGADDKVLMYGAADICVAPSDNIQETFGLSILEAMAAGKPVVAAAWNGYRELVVDGETGILVPTVAAAPSAEQAQVARMAEGVGGYGHRDLHESVAVDPFALTAALAALAQAPERRAAMGAAGAQRCRSHFSLVAQGQHMGALLLELHAAAQSHKAAEAPQRQAFVDPVGKRFAHYPSAGLLGDTDVVRLSPWARSPAWQRQALPLLPLAGRTERPLIEQMLALLVDAPGMQVAELADRLHSPIYDAAQIKLRIARALKYGVLQLPRLLP